VSFLKEFWNKNGFYYFKFGEFMAILQMQKCEALN
jgi:hypothetical protein